MCIRDRLADTTQPCLDHQEQERQCSLRLFVVSCHHFLTMKSWKLPEFTQPQECWKQMSLPCHLFELPITLLLIFPLLAVELGQNPVKSLYLIAVFYF